MTISEATVSWALANSDPANVILLAVVWYRLDDRVKEVRSLVRESQNAQQAAEQQRTTADD